MVHWRDVFEQFNTDYQKWIMFIENNKNVLNEVDERGMSILEAFIEVLHLNTVNKEKIYQIIQLLLHNGADPNLDHTYQTTPLHEAVKLQDTFIVNLLLQYGAKVDTWDDADVHKTKKTALYYACKSGNSSIIKSLIRYGDCLCSSILSAPDFNTKFVFDIMSQIYLTLEKEKEKE